MLTQEQLKNILDYNPDTGVFTRRYGGQGTYAGRIVGTRSTKGYLFTSIGNRLNHKKYSLHRLAWLYMTGKWPKEQIDHINLIKDDNRWVNLREANNSQNHFNRPKQKNNTTGFKGIWIDPRNTINPYVAQIMYNGKKKFLGCFQTPEEAHKAYCFAVEKYHGEFGKGA